MIRSLLAGWHDPRRSRLGRPFSGRTAQQAELDESRHQFMIRVVSEAADDLRERIDAAEGFDRRLLITVLKHLAGANFVRPGGRTALEALDGEFPEPPAYEPMRTAGGRYAAAQGGGTASDMLLANVKDH